MGFRFQRRVSLFPGVRLNFSARGISTTIGVRGAGITLGSRGAYLHAGLPGTGISYRSRISAPSQRSPNVPSLPVTISHYGPETEIASADVSALTSPGLDDFKKLIIEAMAKRVELKREFVHAKRHQNFTKLKCFVARLFIIRLAMQNFIPKLARAAFEARKFRESVEEQLSCCVVDVDFGVDGTALQKFDALVAAFQTTCGCDRIWDVTSKAAIDRYHARSWAGTAVRRKPVRFNTGGVEVIRSAKPALRFANANGLDVLVYPTFALIQKSRDDFALIDIRELELNFSSTGFSEEDSVPTDSEVIGHTWKKANKDGSRDRRFNGNYQIPILRYGELSMRSQTGLEEAYMFSSYEKTTALSRAWSDTRNALNSSTSSEKNSAETQPESILQIDEPHTPERGEEFVSPTPPKTLLYDWIALPFATAFIVVLVIFGTREVRIFSHYVDTIQTTQSESSPVALIPLPAQSFPVTPKRDSVLVQTRVANVRSRPSTAARVVARAKMGDIFEVFEHKGHWIQVGTGRPIGWIRENFVTVPAP